MATPSFLGIPVELRLRIYEFLLAPKYKGYPAFPDYLWSDWCQLGKSQVHCLGPAQFRMPLLFTCKQVFSEVLPVFFEVNIFTWTKDSFAKQSLGKNFDFIQRVHLQASLRETRSFNLPASCRTLKLSFDSFEDFFIKDILDRERLMEGALVPAWIDMVKQLKNDGLKQLIITYNFDRTTVRELEEAFAEAAGPGTVDQ